MEPAKKWKKFKESGTYRRKIKAYRRQYKNRPSASIADQITDPLSANSSSSQFISTTRADIECVIPPEPVPTADNVESDENTENEYVDEYDGHGNGSDMDDNNLTDADENEDEFESDQGEEFKPFLQKWAIQNNIRHTALKTLMYQLNYSFKAGLPNDPRTLLGTCTTPSLTPIDFAGGKYWHQGMEVCLRSCFSNLQTSLSIEINVNIDGLPIFENGKDQFWPILFNVHSYTNIKPMVIGMFYGHSKPSRVEEYLKPFVDELVHILNQGIFIGEYKLNVKVRAFICDSPARSFIKG